MCLCILWLNSYRCKVDKTLKHMKSYVFYQSSEVELVVLCCLSLVEFESIRLILHIIVT